jgi:prepilin-type N-terminal cleavage/methylation domain-containing protein
MKTKLPFYCAIRRGFTLIEILAVIAVISILMGLVLALGPGVIRRQKESTAKAQMANLKTALESFKAAYGYYPTQTENRDIETFGKSLFKQLTGYYVPRVTTTNAESKLQIEQYNSVNPNARRRPFMVSETSVPFRTREKSSDGSNGDSRIEEGDKQSGDCYFIDPWGNIFAYAYRLIKAGKLDNYGDWKNPSGYLLISAGGTYEETEEDTGGLLADDEFYFGGEMMKTGKIPSDEDYFYEAKGNKGVTNRVDNIVSWKENR